MIVAEKLGKQFHDRKRGVFRAVDEVSFRCEPGRVYGLLGANGAGKTTTLRMLATILTPTSGTAIVAGYDIRAIPKKSALTSVFFPPRRRSTGALPRRRWSNISAASTDSTRTPCAAASTRSSSACR